MTYTITDNPSFVDIVQWKAFPSFCYISYTFELIEKNPAIEKIINLDGGGLFMFASDDMSVFD